MTKRDAFAIIDTLLTDTSCRVYITGKVRHPSHKRPVDCKSLLSALCYVGLLCEVYGYSPLDFEIYLKETGKVAY